MLVAVACRPRAGVVEAARQPGEAAVPRFRCPGCVHLVPGPAEEPYEVVISFGVATRARAPYTNSARTHETRVFPKVGQRTTGPVTLTTTQSDSLPLHGWFLPLAGNGRGEFLCPSARGPSVRAPGSGCVARSFSCS